MFFRFNFYLISFALCFFNCELSYGSSGCPNSWTTYGNYCYYLYHSYWSSFTFGEAENWCAQNYTEAHLVWITSEQENAWVLNLTKTVYESTMWIGLQKPCPSPSPWYWTSMQNLTYQNYVSSPYNSVGYNCVKLYEYHSFSGQVGQWDHEDCSLSKYNFVCKGPMSEFTPPPPTNFQPGCSQGWCRHDSFCYQANRSPELPWESAEAKCASQGGHLASIHTSAENNYTKLMADTVYTYTSEFWIGFNILNSYNGQFEWSDGTSSDFFNWAPGQPDKSNGAESCVEIFGDIEYKRPSWRGLWNDDRCDGSRPYICKKYAQGFTPPPVTTQAPVIGGCQPGWASFMGRCYKTFSSAATRENASSACQAFGGRSNLISIRNSFEQSFVTFLLKRSGQDAWLGMHIDYYGTVSWNDESLFVYSNWLKSPEYGDHCSYIHAISFPGKWSGLNYTACQNVKLPYICTQLPNPNLPTASPTPNNCPKGFMSFKGDACYNFNSSLQTWQDAEKTCKSIGQKVDLASINNQFELSYIIAAAKTAGISGFWIGLSNIENSNAFQWSDSWPVFLTQWGPGQPDKDQKKQCVFMATNNTQSGANWYNDVCSKKRISLCKYSTIPIPTVETPGYCPAGWVTGSTKCFYINNVKMSFAEAHFNCEQKMGQNLASFHNIADIKLLAKQQSIQQSASLFYIGLYQTKTSGYVWTDGSDANFFYWAAGEPSNLAAPEQTVTALDNDGKWHNVEYHKYLPSVCEMPKQLATTVPPQSTTQKCNTTGYNIEILLEYYDNSAGGGLLAQIPPAHCDQFWFTGVDQCDLALQICVEPSTGSQNPLFCATNWVDLEQVTWNKNKATFASGQKYGGWSNPMIFSFQGSNWNSGFQLKLKAYDVDNGGSQLADQFLCKTTNNGSKSGSLNCSHKRGNGYPTSLGLAYIINNLC